MDFVKYEFCRVIPRLFYFISFYTEFIQIFYYFIRYITRITHNLGIKKGFHIHNDSYLFSCTLCSILLQESCVSVLTRNVLLARRWIKHVSRLAFKVHWTIASTKA